MDPRRRGPIRQRIGWTSGSTVLPEARDRIGVVHQLAGKKELLTQDADERARGTFGKLEEVGRARLLAIAIQGHEDALALEAVPLSDEASGTFDDRGATRGAELGPERQGQVSFEGEVSVRVELAQGPDGFAVARSRAALSPSEPAATPSLESLDAALLGGVEWILEADIEMLQARVADKSLLRLIGKCLHVGGLDGAEFSAPEDGTVLGSVLSPLLGNVYLHRVSGNHVLSDEIRR
ncbi:hypothetical protein [Sorangium sp. So ce145]